MSRFWSEQVHTLTPYTPGEQPQIENITKLNTNENPYGPSPKVIQAIKRASDDSLRKYPDPNASLLKQSIANYYHMGAEQIFVGNSSDEVLAHCFQALLKQKEPLLFPDITYSFYPVYCQLFNIDYQQVPLNDAFEIDLQSYSSTNGGVIFANPNAPTGIDIGLAEIEKFLQKNTESVVVVDEAYVDFGAHSAVSLVNQYDNLLVIQTLSKSRSLAGLRVGFAIGNSDLIEALERVKNSFHPYALDALALAGAKAAIEDVDHFEKTRDKVVASRARTLDELSMLGFSALDSSANFIFVQHPRIPAQEIFTKLREQGIITRYFDKPRIDKYLRISIGTDDEMDRLIAALRGLV